MGQLKVMILGCGASGGVPAIGNNWGKCDPHNPRNDRTRAAVAVQSDNTTLIIDTGPDLRFQVNRVNIERVHAVLYTHAHADHIAGIDDMRSFQRRYKQSIPVFGDKATIEELKNRFEYMFIDKNNGFLYPKVLDDHIFRSTDYCTTKTFGDIEYIPFEQDHVTCTSLGYRFGNLAYSTDMVDLPPESIDAIKGVKNWVVDGAGYFGTPVSVHANIERLLELNEKVQAENLYLTHLSLMMDYEEMLERLPEGFYPCYDGLIFNTQ